MSAISVGFMSGTSCDGVDVAILDTDGRNQVTVLGGFTHPYDVALRSRLLHASQQDIPIVELLRLERDLSIHHVRTFQLLLDANPPLRSEVSILGFHGHTVRHIPEEALTLQIGNPWILAEELGIPVVADFRRCDLAAGGEGAPLVPLFHQALFANEDFPTMVLNLGGVANVTWLGEQEQIVAGDTGPGCGLIDAWVQKMAGLPYDRDGKIAMSGQVDNKVVEAALATAFFSRPLPKSADRYDFEHVDVSGLSVENGAATLCAISVEAVYRAALKLPKMPTQLFVTGGGVHHPLIMRLLKERFGEVRSVRERGLDPDTLEAQCFAWLAVRHLKKLPLTIPETTGCKRPQMGGVTVQSK